jgi:protein phosphatase
MFVLGGRTNNVGENVQLEVYETESSEWKKFNCLQRFRHSVWVMDHYIYMHGGFENETPNIPTNTIVRLDLTTVFKGNQMMLSKLEQFVGTSAQAGARSASANGSTKGGSETSSRSQTPPLGGKLDNAKIKISQPEVDFGDGQRPKIVSLSFMDDSKKKDGAASKVATMGGPGAQNRTVNSVDTLYQLFLNHLLRPREWTA